MKVELHSGLSHPEVKDATRVVIRDHHGNIVATFLQLGNDNIDIRVNSEPGFDKALKFLGIEQTTVVEKVSGKDLPVIQI